MIKDSISKLWQGWAWVPVFFLLVAADQYTKFLARNVFLNNRFAFSLPVPVWVMYGIYAAVLCGSVAYFLSRRKNLGLWPRLAWVLIWAGALSNVGERLVLGYVRDWFYILNGVFNLADGFIILGMLILLVQHNPADNNA